MSAKKNKKSFSMHDDHQLTEEQEASGAEQIPANLSSQMDEVVRGLSGTQPAGQVYSVDVRQLLPYPDQPFREYPMERLRELAEDIKRVGVLSPILARRKANRLQIMAGHNRWQAAKLAGLNEVPVLILEADDDQAILILTSTNLRQREHLYPSEKAFAYKLQMEALKRQGRKSETGEAYDASAAITSQTGDSRMQIHRYIRLSELQPGLLELLDRGKISMTPAVSASYLDPECQHQIHRWIREQGASLTIEKASRLKELATKGKVTMERIDEIMSGSGKEKKIPKTVSIPYDRIKSYIPQNLEPHEIEELIVRSLQSLKR